MAISKSVRFEVFKRDSFKCQYCGASAPDVLLEADHIKPRAAGGSDDLVNLITACEGCNRGKAARELDDNSVVVKQRTQLEKLQERREQLEMMMQWSQGLQDLQQQGVEWLYGRWEELAPGFTLSEHGRQQVRRWSRRFSLDEISRAMSTAADSYLQRNPDDQEVVTQESWNHAFSKIPAIAGIERQEAEDPGVREIYRLRARLRAQLGLTPYKSNIAFRYLDRARKAGVPMAVLNDLVGSWPTWRQFEDRIWEYIEEAEAG